MCDDFLFSFLQSYIPGVPSQLLLAAGNRFFVFLTSYWYIKSKLAGNLLKRKSKLKPLLRKAVLFRRIPREIKQ